MEDVLSSLRQHVDLNTKLEADLRSLEQRGHLQIGGSELENPKIRHLIWCPNSHVSHPIKSSTNIVSSRIGRQLDKKDEFFRVLRVACSQLAPDRQSLISSPGTAAHPFVVRAAELFGLDLQTVQVANKTRSLEKWARECLYVASPEDQRGKDLFVSPPLLEPPAFPLRDAVPIMLADQVLAIHLRPSGNIRSLIQLRLQSSAATKVFLALGHEQLVSRTAADPLLSAGAIGWLPLQSSTALPLREDDTSPPREPPIGKLDDLSRTNGFLTHCTRGSMGPWPDQKETDFLDELILGLPTRDRSPLSSLIRILQQQRIRATGEAIRDSTPVVSFTAVDLADLPSLRCFRSHRGRWDFEPYGIAFDRNFMKQLGAREVTYGNEARWKTLSKDEKPFFQRISEEDNSIDWSIEQEYRLPHDFELHEVPSDRAYVFVPTIEEARQVTRLSRWPVFVMPKG